MHLNRGNLGLPSEAGAELRDGFCGFAVTGQEVVEISRNEPDEAGALDTGDSLGLPPIVEGARCDSEIGGSFLFGEKCASGFDGCGRSLHGARGFSQPPTDAIHSQQCPKVNLSNASFTARSGEFLRG